MQGDFDTLILREEAESEEARSGQPNVLFNARHAMSLVLGVDAALRTIQPLAILAGTDSTDVRYRRILLVPRHEVDSA